MRRGKDKRVPHRDYHHRRKNQFSIIRIFYRILCIFDQRFQWVDETFNCLIDYVSHTHSNKIEKLKEWAISVKIFKVGNENQLRLRFRGAVINTKCFCSLLLTQRFTTLRCDVMCSVSRERKYSLQYYWHLLYCSTTQIKIFFFNSLSLVYVSFFNFIFFISSSLFIWYARGKREIYRSIKNLWL